MSVLPERTVEFARHAVVSSHHDCVNSSTAASDTLIAAMDPALGPDRLVVAGPFEQEIIDRACAWLDQVATHSTDGAALRWAAAELAAHGGSASN